MRAPTFQFGRERIDVKFEKRYYPFISRFGRRRYAGRGKFYFRKATQAQNYARRWAGRAGSILQLKAKHANKH